MGRPWFASSFFAQIWIRNEIFKLLNLSWKLKWIVKWKDILWNGKTHDLVLCDLEVTKRKIQSLEDQLKKSKWLVFNPSSIPIPHTFVDRKNATRSEKLCSFLSLVWCDWTWVLLQNKRMLYSTIVQSTDSPYACSQLLKLWPLISLYDQFFTA